MKNREKRLLKCINLIFIKSTLQKMDQNYLEKFGSTFKGGKDRSR